MSTQQIIIVILSLVAGVGMLFITMLAVARIAEEIHLYFAAPLLMIAYFGALVYGALYWRPLALIVTGVIWGLALLLALLDWRSQNQDQNQEKQQQET